MHAYFRAYAIALQKQAFDCWYIDAFAGTGERIGRHSADYSDMNSLFGDEASEVAAAKNGSVQIALTIEPPFKQYLFIDISRDHIARLNELQADHPNRSIAVIPGDANDILTKLCRETDWVRTRAAIFIDPYGMQVQWSTLEHLANTKAVDIALLFPTGPLNRLLKRDGNIPEDWARRIDQHLGPCDWRSAFYTTTVNQDLFGNVAETEKSAKILDLQKFVQNRLQTIFSYVHDEPVPLRNSKGSLLYDLFIICANSSERAIALSKRLAKGAIRASYGMNR